MNEKNCPKCKDTYKLFYIIGADKKHYLKCNECGYFERVKKENRINKKNY